MNNRKSKSKKRKISDADESSGDDASDVDEVFNSDSDVDKEDSCSSDINSYSESQSSSSSCSVIKPLGRTKNCAANVLLSDSSESGDESCEKCAICLRSITSQEVGNPEVCDHLFCSVCIIEWSKNSNVCPLDRQQFSIILVRKNKEGNVVKKVPVEESQAAQVENVELEELDDTVCEICGSGDREDIMLLCDICDRGFHTICLTPPLENIPDENEWFCPDCDYRAQDRTESLTNGLEEFFDVPSNFRPLRPRIQMVRTRLLERIRVTVNRIVENYVLQHPDELETSEDESSGGSNLDLDSDFAVSDDQPGTSGLQTASPKEKKSQPRTRKRKTPRSRKRSSASANKATRRKKTSSTKRKKSTSARTRTKKRKTKVRTTRTKKVKVENEDGTITEKIVKTRTYRRRKQKRKKRKVKTLRAVRRGLRVKSITTPKTVKGRLALTLGMVPPKKPGQLLPDVKIRPNNREMTAIDLNRARAGIPKLHIFGPRDELQYYSSDSEREDLITSSSGGVATVAQQRTNLSRIRDRKKAALALQSFSSQPKPKPIVEPPASEYDDILGSILDSQAIWHSKNTNVKIREDGSIEVIKDREENNLNKATKPQNGKTIDVREKNSDGMTTQAPMYPGAGSRPGGFRPYNRTSYGESRGGQDDVFSPRSAQSSTGVNFSRFGGTARNDREGYANYLNNIPQGPTPFCRGGPPLRFRMPPRQQLRRIPFPPRNRPAWQPEEDDRTPEKDGKKDEEEASEQTQSKTQEDEDIDLYSDIETNADKTDNSGPEDGPPNYPALGPPPEPSAFLLGLDENGEFGVAENKDKSEVYDPAEPCDSEDEMVIDENKERSASPEKKEPEPNKTESSPSPTGSQKAVPPPTKPSSQKASSEDDDDEDEDCPIFSIYSPATRKFSQKEEEERQREIAEDRKKLEEMKLLEEQKQQTETFEKEESPQSETAKEEEETPELGKESISLSSQKDDKKKEKSRETVGSRLSFDFEFAGETKGLSQEESSPSNKSGRESSRSRSKSITDDKEKDERDERRSLSSESEKNQKSKSPCSARDKSSSPERTVEKFKRSKRKSENYDSDSEADTKKAEDVRRTDDDKEKDEISDACRKEKVDEKSDKGAGSESEVVQPKVATGLEGLDVEEVSSDNGDGAEFGDKRSLSSFSLSELSNASKRSKSPVQLKKKKKNKKRKTGRSKPGKNYEEGEIDDSEKDNRLDESFEASKNENIEIGNENSPKQEEKRKRKSASTVSERQVLGSKENKKVTKEKSNDKDLSWKKPSKKEKNYREGKKRSKDRGRSKSNDRRKSRSPSPKKDKKKNKDRKKKADKKKDIERYDVRKIVKNKEVRKTDAFGRDIISKSRSITRSRSRSLLRGRSRNMLRRDSRSYSRSRSRSFRRGRSPVRRRYLRSRTRSRSKSLRRTYSRSRSRSRSRKSKKKVKSKDRLKIRSRSRGRKSRSVSRGRRRSLSRSRSRSPIPRIIRSKKAARSRRSWSHHVSRSPSFSPRRSRSITRSPIRVRRSYSRSVSTSWSRGRSPLPRTSSLEKLTVVLTTKDKKKWKKKKEGKKNRKEEKKRKKTGNSKEVFASGDNVLVSVNFRNNNNNNNNNNNSTGVNNNSSVINSDSRNTRVNSMSPVPGTETSRKKRKGSDYETERVTKKSKKSNPISKKVVDVALSNACPKRTKKLTRLSEKDAEVILNRKPVAVIDLDMSPYREQTPSPVNVVVVSDSGSGDEGKEHTPQRPTVRGTPAMEGEKIQENVGVQSVSVSAPSSPVENGYVPTSGPKTPPEPQIKFSISKPQQLRQIANPLGDDDDDEVDEDEGEQRMESLDRRIEKELNPRIEMPHKGPNTPPAPRGPSTPKTPPSPQTSPDAYDPFEPTKSRSPSPSQADKENRPSPKLDGKDDQAAGGVLGEGSAVMVSNLMVDNPDKINDVIIESREDKIETSDKGEAIPVLDCSSNLVIPSQTTCAPGSDITVNESPERKITVVITTPQNKTQAPTMQKSYAPVLKQLPMVTSATAAPPTSATLTVSSDVFSIPSPTKTSRANTTTTQTAPMTGIQRLQHRLGSPVNRTPNSVKTTPEKRSTPRTEANEIFSSGNYMVRNAGKRNGEQPKQPRPLQDATNETIDITVDMDDSPYSPASSEGDDLFDPPVEPSKPSQSNSKPAPSYKAMPKGPRKSPAKQLSKFDLLFGLTGPALSPLKVGNKKANAKPGAKTPTAPKVLPPKPQKKAATKKNVMHKMDEDQLRILDELPSSAVELQVKDKFLKKLNRQERVVDEVKTVLKPHYARKHITKEEYKDILRRSVPKICHSRSGEINPSKIQSLIEAYVKKFRHAKKKGVNAVSKTKGKKTLFS